MLLRDPQDPVMVPTLFRSKKDRYRRRQADSPSSSPFATRSRPSATPRSVLDDSRRVAADYDDDIDNDDEEDEGNNDVEEEEEHTGESEGDEDGLTPLLPIFEAAHLGMRDCSNSVCSDANNRRCFTSLQPHACHSFLGRSTM